MKLTVYTCLYLYTTQESANVRLEPSHTACHDRISGCTGKKQRLYHGNKRHCAHNPDIVQHTSNGHVFYVLFSILSLRKGCNKALVINYWEGLLQNGKIVGPKLFAPPPWRQGKVVCAPPFKGWELVAPPPPIIMAQTSSSRVKTTSKLVVPPLQHGLNFF